MLRGRYTTVNCSFGFIRHQREGREICIVTGYAHTIEASDNLIQTQGNVCVYLHFIENLLKVKTVKSKYLFQMSNQNTVFRTKCAILKTHYTSEKECLCLSSWFQITQKDFLVSYRKSTCICASCA